MRTAPLSRLWLPGVTIPFGTNHAKVTFRDLVRDVHDDILVTDRLLLPNSGELFPFQRVTMKGLADHKITFIQACRGSSKSWLVARYILNEALRNPITVVCTGPTFRQALMPWNYVVRFIEENSGDEMLLDLSKEIRSITKGGTEGQATITFWNGSVIKALPMGNNGTRLRGERADILVCDEFFLMERSMYREHIVPFLLGHKPADAIGPKLIMSTSAEYEDSYAYKVLTNTVLTKIKEETALIEAGLLSKRTTICFDWNIDDLRAQRLTDGTAYKIDDDVIKLLIEGTNDEERQQTLYNRWVGVSGQFMPNNLVEKMSQPDIFIEHEAEPGFTYALSVDVATQADGDKFVIHVLKFLGDRKCAVVNSFSDRGLQADEMAWKIHYFNDKFSPTWIVMDKGGGGLFVAQSLAKRKLVFSDGKEVTVVRPILEHCEARILGGERKLILTKPADAMVRQSFVGDRARGGDYINSEDIYVDLLYNGLRQTLGKTDPPFVIPASCGNQIDDLGRTEIEILSDIRDAIYQLKHLTVKVQKMPDGSKQIVRSKINKVPTYTWKSSQKDGASAFCYGYIAYNLIYKDARGEEQVATVPQVQPMHYDSPTAQYAGVWEDASQTINPFRPRN